MKPDQVFDCYGIKTVTKTDKEKSAYVLNAEQNQAVQFAGIKPSLARPADPFELAIFGDTSTSVLASYYHAERSRGADRTPEPRMGRQFISDWLQVGDQVLIGNIGSELFAMKITGATDALDLPTEIARVSPVAVFERAKRAQGKPKATTVTRNDFVRDPYVVQAALLRSRGKCEMPGCDAKLFSKPEDVPYLEVHHVIPLGEGGDDSLANAAALCPSCHREQHHGKLKMEKRAQLQAAISTKNA